MKILKLTLFLLAILGLGVAFLQAIPPPKEFRLTKDPWILTLHCPRTQVIQGQPDQIECLVLVTKTTSYEAL